MEENIKTDSPSPRSVDIVVGPSHAIRWNWHVRDGVVPCPVSADCIYGFGGAPIWSKRLFEATRDKLGASGRLGVMVPDFRFGNAIRLEGKDVGVELMRDGYLGIRPEAMTQENDHAMLQHGIAALEVWHREFGDRAQYVFWCLFGRQVFDRLARRHVVDRRYCHPTFNYDEVIAALPGLDVIDLSPLLRMQMHEVRRLFIDTSSHPSQIGFLFLNGLLFGGLEVRVAYDKAVADVEAQLLELARDAARAIGSRIVLTGRSIWLETLSGYMGAKGAARLAEAGLVLAPLDPAPGQPAIGQIMEGLCLKDCAVVVISAGGADISPLLARAFGSDLAFWSGKPVIDWESATGAAIRSRGETPRFTRVDPNLPVHSRATMLDIQAAMVEQGPFGMPSWTGMTHVLASLPKIYKPNSPEVHARDYRVHGDVLLTENGRAFLIGGNHAVLKFATGELTPNTASLKAFAGNISGRLQFAQSSDLPYLHVIFPDKQSVMMEDFPFQPVRRLGDLYLEHMPPSLRDYVLYPADALRNDEALSPFLPLDTHMTDHGSLAVLRLMLEKVGIKADGVLAHIRDRIVKAQRWPGDLGSKFSPPLFQEGMVLDPDWPIKQYRSPGGFNDGMIDILLNPEAAVTGTVLLFGDSFFRMMLLHLSTVFERVVCLRSRFFHREMVILIQPDYIFTGNVERYLSNVTSDTEANAFAIYPHLRDDPDHVVDKNFLAAWSAVTSPGSRRAKEFFAGLGIPRRSALRLGQLTEVSDG